MTPLVLTHPPAPGELTRDKRYTPAWVTQTLLDHVPPPRSRPVLDPACGAGAILEVCSARGYATYGCDIDADACVAAAPAGRIQCIDWLRPMTLIPTYEVASVVMNPPYSAGPRFLEVTFQRLDCNYVAALLRLNHLGSATWAPMWRQHPPQCLIVLGSRRPSFSGDGQTDASEYAWFVWCSEREVSNLARIEVV